MKSGDTTRLLRECESGVKMGVEAIDEVLGRVESPELRKILSQGKKEHEKLQEETGAMLSDLREPDKAPPAMARAASWIKTEAVMNMKEPDSAAAGLMTKGCAMGIESLSRYLNQYPAASSDSRRLARRIIETEETLAHSLRPYL